MNFDAAISFLGHSDWGFLALCLVLLAVAFAACFSEPTSTHQSRTDRSRS
ncbi:MAG TPA: hypothetical protein VJO35_17910 [Terriglobales bacterium]|nr:hypothetical protein [Terriglobales bacterium]